MEAATTQLPSRVVLNIFFVADEARGEAVAEFVRYSYVGGLECKYQWFGTLKF